MGIKDGNQDVNPPIRTTVYETKTRGSPTCTTGVTHEVWSNQGSLPVINETGPFRSITSTSTVNPNKTYPKLLSGVEMFHSAHSPLSFHPVMSYAERTGAGHTVMSSDGTIKYQYFGPIETGVHQEHDTFETRGVNLQAGHGTVPDQGYVGPLMEGGNYRHQIAHQLVPQFFSGSGGAMSENYGYRFTRPTPHELHRATL